MYRLYWKFQCNYAEKTAILSTMCNTHATIPMVGFRSRIEYLHITLIQKSSPKLKSLNQSASDLNREFLPLEL